MSVRNYSKPPTRSPDCAICSPGREWGELHFSRCTEWPWAWDVPYIQPAANGEYWVSGPLRSESVGPAVTPQQAVTMVVDRLPPNCGPALVGALSR
ncbi:DUF6193 family natural product biosynthesis protein [Streptomyces brevispora]|uniref:DUF6193 family natural product biosynthesis protein n=1 Tax=Streptomyces brevispora TaxID=887462 RepID=UPI0037FB747F